MKATTLQIMMLRGSTNTPISSGAPLENVNQVNNLMSPWVWPDSRDGIMDAAATAASAAKNTAP